MKKLFAFAFLASALMTSCADDFKYKSEEPGFGTLSFADLQISVDDSENIVRANEASGTYLITIKNAEGAVYGTYTYSNIKAEGISLPAGVYSLEVLSAESVPAAEFEGPVYGAQVEDITITAGDTTPVGTITCTLQQCKVTVGYNDDFLAMVKGNCTTTVSIGESLDYNIVWDSTNSKISKYEQSAGYFNVNNGENTTMTVKFSGAIYDEESESVKVMRMTKTFTGIAAKQWRQIKFIKKINQEGNATFDIVLDEYVEDNPLNEDLTGSEESIGTDPNAPKGDGNIKLLATAGLNENTSPTLTAWNASFTDDEMDIETYEVIVIDDNLTVGTDADGKSTQLLQFDASVPNKIKDFNIVIESAILAPMMAGMMGDAEYIDLVHDTTVVQKIASIIPFPYHDPASGKYVAGETNVSFILDAAVPILRELATQNPGLDHTHTFQMNVRDEAGYTKQINLTLKVEPNSTN